MYIKNSADKLYLTRIVIKRMYHNYVCGVFQISETYIITFVVFIIFFTTFFNLINTIIKYTII